MFRLCCVVGDCFYQKNDYYKVWNADVSLFYENEIVKREVERIPAIADTFGHDGLWCQKFTVIYENYLKPLGMELVFCKDENEDLDLRGEMYQCLFMVTIPHCIWFTNSTGVFIMGV